MKDLLALYLRFGARMADVVAALIEPTPIYDELLAEREARRG